MRIRMVLSALFFLGFALYFKNLAQFYAALGSSVSLWMLHVIDVKLCRFLDGPREGL